MSKWEYQTVTVPFTGGWEAPRLDTRAFDTLLNHLGSEGWELVNIFTTHQERGRSADAFATFKRPIS